MAKGFVRLGILLALLFNNQGARAVAVGDLLITEIMANPAAVADSRGEWFELFNPTAEPISLRDITIGDDGGDLHRIETDLLILPGHFLTLGRNGDPAANGGFEADYVYRDFTLGNSADEILLGDDSTEWLRLEYGPGFAVAGRSRELVGLPARLAEYALTPASWVYGFGDIGTPGAAGSFAPAPAAVPLPAAGWLFASGLLTLLSRGIAAALGDFPGRIRARGTSATRLPLPTRQRGYETASQIAAPAAG
jgi:hypothetical protein